LRDEALTDAQKMPRLASQVSVMPDEKRTHGERGNQKTWVFGGEFVGNLVVRKKSAFPINPKGEGESVENRPLKREKELLTIENGAKSEATLMNCFAIKC
jgi:hypothetical protein